MNILITGGNGYIAKSLYTSMKDRYDVIVVTKKEFDQTDHQSVSEWFANKTFDVVIQTAAVGGTRLAKDDTLVVKQNLAMHYNLLENKHRFGRLISFGSGAEIYMTNTPYGTSKRMIADSIRDVENWYNLRIFAVFDENELDTRFIKANIMRYIHGEPMIIHTNKVMDFFYMQDLISLVDHYITKHSPEKEINCSYNREPHEGRITLLNIANMINNMDNHRVPITIENKNKMECYCGDTKELPIPTIGLQRGIQNTFANLPLAFLQKDDILPQ